MNSKKGNLTKSSKRHFSTTSGTGQRNNFIVQGEDLVSNAEFIEIDRQGQPARQYQEFSSLESTLQQINNEVTIVQLQAGLVLSITVNVALLGILLVNTFGLQILHFIGL